MKILSVKCDYCDSELIKDDGYPHSYGLEISVHDYGIKSGGPVFAIHIEPPLKRAHHFCGMGCLKSWVVDS